MSHCVAMYSSVPPPEHQGNPDRVEHKPTSKQEPVPQPDHVSKEQWEVNKPFLLTCLCVHGVLLHYVAIPEAAREETRAVFQG